MNDKLLKKFCSGILISDVISYIDAHPKEYEQYIKKEQKKEDKNALYKNKQSKKAINSV